MYGDFHYLKARYSVCLRCMLIRSYKSSQLQVDSKSTSTLISRMEPNLPDFGIFRECIILCSMLILLLYLWDSLASTTNAPAASRKRVNDESAPEEPPAKRTKKSNPRGGVVKKGVEVETRLEVRPVVPGARRSGRLAKLS
jgi:hypothetical protein